MLSFVGFVSYTLVLSTTLGAVKPLALGRADGGSRVLCARAAVDEDLYRRIMIQDDSYADEEFEGSASDRALQEEEDELFEDGEVFDDVGEDRTDLEWKKIERYIKRQLKVPRRYLKKIVRTLSKVATLRSADGSERMVSVVSPREAEALTDANGGLERRELLLLDEPEPMGYLAVISASANQFYK